MKLEWRHVYAQRRAWGVERVGHTATQMGNRVYLVGGYSDRLGYEFLQPQHCLFNTSTYKWSLLLPHREIGIEEGVSYHSAALVDDRILLLGGYDEVGQRTMRNFSVRWFDPTMNTVRDQPFKGKPPCARFRHVTGYFERLHEVIVFGGKTEQGRKLSDLFSFHVEKMRFIELQAKGAGPRAQSSNFGCVHGAAMYMFCHFEAQLFRLEYNGRLAQWSSMPKAGEVPGRLYGASMNVVNNSLVIFGGIIAEVYQADLYVFDLLEGVWKHYDKDSSKMKNNRDMSGKKFPEPTSRQVGVVVKSKIVLIGGADKRLDETWELCVS